MIEFKIEELKVENLEDAIEVIKVTFLKFEAPDYSKEGIENFFKFANYETIKESLSKTMKIYVAKIKEKIVGVIGYRDNSHINLLFVLEEFQHNGIAKSLYNLVIEKCKKVHTKKVTVNSSPYAHDVYLKFGFIDDNKMQEIDGIKFYPMYKEI